jgi:hypothetical protein
MKRIEQMYGELYNPYPEFEEARMELQERLNTHWDEFVAERERKAEQKGEQKTEQRIITLLKQGYTVEQLEKILAKETQQTTTTTQ